jgi:hypothetical protein
MEEEWKGRLDGNDGKVKRERRRDDGYGRVTKSALCQN